MDEQHQPHLDALVDGVVSGKRVLLWAPGAGTAIASLMAKLVGMSLLLGILGVPLCADEDGRVVPGSVISLLAAELTSTLLLVAAMLGVTRGFAWGPGFVRVLSWCLLGVAVAAVPLLLLGDPPLRGLLALVPLALALLAWKLERTSYFRLYVAFQRRMRARRLEATSS